MLHDLYCPNHNGTYNNVSFSCANNLMLYDCFLLLFFFHQAKMGGRQKQAQRTKGNVKVGLITS